MRKQNTIRIIYDASNMIRNQNIFVNKRNVLVIEFAVVNVLLKVITNNINTLIYKILNKK